MSQKVDYNIEFAHIYANEEFDREHLEATWVLNRKIKELESLGKTYNKVVLIDNYNPSECFLNEKDFISKLAENNAMPDFVAYEASTVHLYEKVLGMIKKNERNDVKRYYRKNGRVPCSFLIVIWHLIRLGLVENELEFYMPPNEGIKKPFVGKRIITILPKRFQSVEERAKDVIAHSPFASALDRLEYIFF